jgi:hypothetical protein
MLDTNGRELMKNIQNGIVRKMRKRFLFSILII